MCEYVCVSDLRLCVCLQWDSSCVYIIMEYCGGGDLSLFIKSRKVLQENVARRFLRQLGMQTEPCVLSEGSMIIRHKIYPSLWKEGQGIDQLVASYFANYGFSRFLVAEHNGFLTYLEVIIQSYICSETSLVQVTNLKLKKTLSCLVMKLWSQIQHQEPESNVEHTFILSFMYSAFILVSLFCCSLQPLPSLHCTSTTLHIWIWSLKISYLHRKPPHLHQYSN